MPWSLKSKKSAATIYTSSQSNVFPPPPTHSFHEPEQIYSSAQQPQESHHVATKKPRKCISVACGLRSDNYHYQTEQLPNRNYNTRRDEEADDICASIVDDYLNSHSSSYYSKYNPRPLPLPRLSTKNQSLTYNNASDQASAATRFFDAIHYQAEQERIRRIICRDQAIDKGLSQLGF